MLTLNTFLITQYCNMNILHLNFERFFMILLHFGFCFENTCILRCAVIPIESFDSRILLSVVVLRCAAPLIVMTTNTKLCRSSKKNIWKSINLYKIKLNKCSAFNAHSLSFSYRTQP